MHKLVISDDGGKTILVPLVRDELTIGRKEGNIVRLIERDVSRHHAVIRRKDDSFIIEDLDSYNGVFVNDERIDGQARLKPGDRIRIGEYKLALDVDGTAPEAVDERPPELDFGDDDDVAHTPARLMMLSPPAIGAVYAVREGTRLGRSEELELWVNHRSISREHLRFEERAGEMYAINLSSVNPLRVNGEERDEVRLESGDILELGKVKFRFLAPGEVFELMNEEALLEEKVGAEKKSGRAVFFGLIFSLALIATLFLVMKRSEVPPDELELRLAEEDAAREAARIEREAAHAAALEECDQAIRDGEFARAIEAADRVLIERPSHEEAAECRADASYFLQEAAIFERGKAALEEGDIAEAHTILSALHEESSLRESEEFLRARALYGELRLKEMRSLMRREPEAAREIADELLALDAIPEETLAEVNRLASRIDRRLKRPRGAN